MIEPMVGIVDSGADIDEICTKSYSIHLGYIDNRIVKQTNASLNGIIVGRQEVMKKLIRRRYILAVKILISKNI